jgi:hypothetical protein
MMMFDDEPAAESGSSEEAAPQEPGSETGEAESKDSDPDETIDISAEENK